MTRTDASASRPYSQIRVLAATGLLLGLCLRDATGANCTSPDVDLDIQYYCSDSQLPDWLEQNRVHGQVGLYNFTRSSMLEREITEIENLGLKAYTRHTKLDWRPPIWPSLVPKTENGESVLESAPDDLADLIEKASLRNIKLLAYYYESAEGIPEGVRRDLLVGSRERYNWNPPSEWHCRTLDGSLIPIEQRKNSPFRGYHLDLNSDYRDFLLQRLIEVVDRGASALYFDERHFPKAQVSPCYGSATEHNYLALGGTLPNTSSSKHTEADFIRFQSRAMAQSFEYLQKGIAKAHPEKKIPFIISGSYLSSYIMPHMSLELANTSDIIKVEYLNGARNGLNGNLFKNKSLRVPPDDIRLALGWVIPRDAGGGKPIHMWHHQFSSVEEITSYAATSQAYGAITGIYIPPQYLRGDRETPETQIGLNTAYEVLVEGIAYAHDISDPLAHTRPHSEFGIYLSEAQKDNYDTGEQVWIQQLAYVNALFEIFIRQGLPIRIVTDKDLAEPDSMRRYKHIFTAKNTIDEQARELLSTNYDLSNVYIHDEPQSFARKNGIDKAMSSLEHDVLKITGDLYSVKSNSGSKERLQSVHSVFHRSLLTGNLLVALVPKPQLEKKKTSENPAIFSGHQLIFRKKPESVRLAQSGVELDIIQIEEKYVVDIPSFRNLTLIDVKH